jgi:hypothetical protein
MPIGFNPTTSSPRLAEKQLMPRKPSPVDPEDVEINRFQTVEMTTILQVARIPFPNLPQVAEESTP